MFRISKSPRLMSLGPSWVSTQRRYSRSICVGRRSWLCIRVGKLPPSSRNLPSTRAEYQEFFSLWKDADPDCPDPETSQGGVREAVVAARPDLLAQKLSTDAIRPFRSLRGFKYNRDFSPIVKASRFGTIPEHGTELVLPGVQRTRFECREQGFSNGVGLER